MPVQIPSQRPLRSIVSVALTELKDLPEFSIPSRDIDVVTTRGSGPGGQARNKQENCVVATHTPSGIKVRIDGKSQYDNKALALQVLKSRVYDLHTRQAQESMISSKREQLKGGSRSSKDKTINLIQGFIKDHRTGNKTSRVKEWFKGHLNVL